MYFDEQVSNMTVSEIVELISELTDQINRCVQELETRAMQTSE